MLQFFTGFGVGLVTAGLGMFLFRWRERRYYRRELDDWYDREADRLLWEQLWAMRQRSNITDERLN